MEPKQKTKKFQIRWNEPLGEVECPYAHRYVFLFFGYALRIHVWKRSDDKRFMHSHPWWFMTFVLKGSYTDVYDENGIVKKDTLKRFSFRFRKADHKHYVDVPKGGCITILLTGRPIQKWGFWIDGKMKRPLKYFYKFGHPPCEEQ
jgi:hypothetical protein